MQRGLIYSRGFFNPFTVDFSSSLPCASGVASAVFLCCIGISIGMLQRGRKRIFLYKLGRNKAGKGP